MQTERDMQRESTRSVINVRGTRGESKSERTVEGQKTSAPSPALVCRIFPFCGSSMRSRGKIPEPLFYLSLVHSGRSLSTRMMVAKFRGMKLAQCPNRMSIERTKRINLVAS